MTLTKLSLGNPVAVAVGCILLGIFGVLSLMRLPIQLAPEVQRPQISISTAWRAAAPQEVESEIVEPQEDQLRGLPGMRRITSSAGQASGNINMEFDLDTDMQQALVEVINRLNQVPTYPVDVSEPRIRVGSDDRGNAIAWFAIKPDSDNPREIITYQDYIDETIRPLFERIDGVATANSFGGRNYEVRVTFDPYKAAALGVDVTAISGDIGNNQDISAGFNEVGRRQYTVRFAGKLDVADLGNLVLRWDEGRPIRLSDIATVEKTLQDRRFIMRQNGGASIAINVIAQSGANVLEIMEEVQATVAELEKGELKQAGLTITQVYDATVYINQSITMVRNNMLIGVLLAIGVLWWFLRKFMATLIVALAIPLCLLAAFMVLDASSRTLNIISLAGLAFATGMVLDAAIVVLENIFRQREQGRSGYESAYRGTTQVWGALLASTATTVAIFMPVVFLRDEAGQLFSDLAVVISAAIVCSLVVAVTVLPAAAAKILGNTEVVDLHRSWWRASTDFVMKITDTPVRRRGWILGLTIIPLLLVVALKPPADYLPEGKQNFAFGFMVTPPGLGFDTAEEELVDVINQRLEPYLHEDANPQLANFFIGFSGGGSFIGVRAEDPQEVDQVLTLLNSEVMQGFPDSFGGASRRAIFGGRGGRRIDIDLQAADYDSLLVAGRVGFAAVQEALEGAQVRPQPGLELAEPELRLVPDDRRIAEVGWTRARMATAVRALGDGVFLGDYFDGDMRLDIVLRAQEWTTPEELTALPIAVPDGSIQTVGDLANMQRTAGPSQIRRIDRRRTLTLQVTPPSGMPLEEAIGILEAEVAPKIQALLPEDGRISYTGTAEALNESLRTMAGSFGLAIVILYLLISAMFRSFKDSLLVIATIPMATVGGVLFLRLLDLLVGQPMDLLTMIGFVILLGLVVNNAILLVYRAREGEHEGMSRREAVASAVRLRLRPILMSTMTSVFGMLPLLLIPGAGSELYRGMAAVIVGGMLVSTLFTLILLPSLLRFREEHHPAVDATMREDSQSISNEKPLMEGM